MLNLIFPAPWPFFGHIVLWSRVNPAIHNMSHPEFLGWLFFFVRSSVWAGSGLIQIPILRHWRRQRATMFEPRRRRGEFGCEPAGDGSKIVGFEYSLDFFGYFFASRQKSNDAKIKHKLLIINEL
jgi:hypothetical protein